MAITKQTLTWTEIDPASLPADVRQQYEAYKAAYHAMKQQRQAFETMLNDTASPPSGKRVVCGYNFGKLSIALGDAKDQPKASQAKGSLADFLANAQTSGRRA